jgi:hypothetical protein
VATPVSDDGADKTGGKVEHPARIAGFVSAADCGQGPVDGTKHFLLSDIAFSFLFQKFTIIY